jgi:hypothetical protein
MVSEKFEDATGMYMVCFVKDLIEIFCVETLFFPAVDFEVNFEDFFIAAEQLIDSLGVALFLSLEIVEIQVKVVAFSVHLFGIELKQICYFGIVDCFQAHSFLDCHFSFHCFFLFSFFFSCCNSLVTLGFFSQSFLLMLFGIFFEADIGVSLDSHHRQTHGMQRNRAQGFAIRTLYEAGFL